jgi:NAD(P)H dehydrogenase (quinone)
VSFDSVSSPAVARRGRGTGLHRPAEVRRRQPYGVSHVTGGGNDAPLTEAENAALDHLAERIVTIGGKLKD